MSGSSRLDETPDNRTRPDGASIAAGLLSALLEVCATDRALKRRVRKGLDRHRETYC